MSQVVAPLLSKIIARFLLNAENSGWRLGLGTARTDRVNHFQALVDSIGGPVPPWYRA